MICHNTLSCTDLSLTFRFFWWSLILCDVYHMMTLWLSKERVTAKYICLLIIIDESQVDSIIVCMIFCLITSFASTWCMWVAHDKVILIYIHSWISENVAKVILVRCQWDSLNLYSIINDLLNKLAQLYDYFDKETNFWREYFNLTQEIRKFNEFYSLFQRLSFYLNYHKRQLITDLWDKIAFQLHAA